MTLKIDCDGVEDEYKHPQDVLFSIGDGDKTATEGIRDFVLDIKFKIGMHEEDEPSRTITRARVSFGTEWMGKDVVEVQCFTEEDKLVYSKIRFTEDIKAIHFLLG